MGEKVKIESLVSRSVALIDRDLRVSRTWEKKGSVRTIDFDVLQEMIYDPGVAYMFEQGILGIQDMDVKIRLGLEPEGAKAPENIITLTDTERDNYLRNYTLKQFKEKIQELPREQVIELANYAIEHEIADFPKSEVLKRLIGIDIISAIKLNRADKEELKVEE